MDQEIKASWVARLRSRQDAQGSGFLLRTTSDGKEEKKCCLGVLAEVCGVPRSTLFEGYLFNGTRSNRIPPEGFAGLTIAQLDKLAQLNDVDKKPFPQIADWIEENL